MGFEASAFVFKQEIDIADFISAVKFCQSQLTRELISHLK